MSSRASVRRARYETLLLAIVLASASAFVVSFVGGIGGSADTPAPAAIESFAPANLDDTRVGRVEVLNGAGEAGWARDATMRLREAGFDVVYFGNATVTGVDSSIVYSRIMNDEVAHAAARALGITRVVSQPDTTLYVDASILLGADWRPSISTRAR
ncbi:MAG: LytR C-terminal domain-containing protein [Longimicrobiales bacterium]